MEADVVRNLFVMVGLTSLKFGRAYLVNTDLETDVKIQNNHRIDSLNILLYTFLLILTVVTIWIFKYKRARYLHETGLAVIYGLIVGCILRYTGDSTTVTHQRVVNAANSTPYADVVPPDTLWYQFNKDSGHFNKTYVYQFRGDIPNSQETEIVQKATFDPEIFFNILLPPIIFNAGYSLKKLHFFRNLGAIFAFAFIGTTISAFTIAGLLYGLLFITSNHLFTFTDCLLFGTLISSTDPVTILAIFTDLRVDVNLYALVFGESVLNDAVAIVMSSAIESYGSKSGNFETLAFFSAALNFVIILTASLMIGVVMGCLTAILTKFTRLRDFPLLESVLFVLMSYSTFLMAEASNLTGIVAVLFCGICQAHYTFNNLSPDSRMATKSLFELLNFLSENFIFSYIGVSMFTFEHHRWEIDFIVFAFIGIFVGRAMNIYVLSGIMNLRRTPKIPSSFMHMLMFSGLRGAIAFALAIRNASTDARKAIITTTSLIVIITVILIGGMTTQVLSWLGIPVDVDEEETHHLNQFQPIRNAYSTLNSKMGPMSEDTESVNSSSSPHHNATAASSAMGTHQNLNTENCNYEKAWLFRLWSDFDVRFMKPFLTNSRPTLLDTTPVCCAPLARLLTTTDQLTQERDPLDDSMPLDDSLLGSRPPSVYPSRQMTHPLSDGDLGVSTGHYVNTKVAVPGHTGQSL